MARKSMGRQKVEMKKMVKESNLQVTFSKRRSGLFKKASELSTLCGAEVGIIVFSPGNKVFSFGHPGVETIVDRYLARRPGGARISGTMQLIEAHRNANVRELNLQLTQVTNQLEAEKKRGEELSQMGVGNGKKSQNWWENPIEEQSLSQLEQLKLSLDELKKNVAKQAEKLMQQNSNPNPPQQQQQFFAPAAASSSNNINGGGGVPAYGGLQPNMMMPGQGLQPNMMMPQGGLQPNMMMPQGFNNNLGYGPRFY